MAGIFDLFGNTEDPVQRAANMPDQGGTMRKPGQPGIRFGFPGSTPAKVFRSTSGKPKGLSMRSFSDLNVKPTNSKPSMGLKGPQQTELLKPSVTQMDIDGRPISPRSRDKHLKMKDLKPVPMKSSSPKLKVQRSSPTLRLPQDSIFKKPLTPTLIQINKHSLYPEPEKLAYHYDETENYFNADEQPLEADYQELVATLTRSLQIYDDEGFESDPEILPYPGLQDVKPYPISSPDNTCQEDSLTLPDISDDEF